MNRSNFEQLHGVQYLSNSGTNELYVKYHPLHFEFIECICANDNFTKNNCFLIQRAELAFSIKKILENTKAAKRNSSFVEMNHLLYPTRLALAVDNYYLESQSRNDHEAVILNLNGNEYDLLQQNTEFKTSVLKDVDEAYNNAVLPWSAGEIELFLNSIGIIPKNELNNIEKEFFRFCYFEITAIAKNQLQYPYLYITSYKSMLSFSKQNEDELIGWVIEEINAVLNEKVTLSYLFQLDGIFSFDSRSFNYNNANPAILAAIMKKGINILFGEQISDSDIKLVNNNKAVTNAVSKHGSVLQFIVFKLHELGCPVLLSLSLLDNEVPCSEVVDYCLTKSDSTNKTIQNCKESLYHFVSFYRLFTRVYNQSNKAQDASI
jgi:hypothetical protein